MDRYDRNCCQPVGPDERGWQARRVQNTRHPRMDRRRFVGRTIAAGTVGLLSGPWCADQKLFGAIAPKVGDSQTLEGFHELVGQTFDVTPLLANRRKLATMYLAGLVVHDRARNTHRPENVRPEGFTLHFKSRRPLGLAEGTYLFCRGNCRIPIFVQPAGGAQTATSLEYIAIFN